MRRRRTSALAAVALLLLLTSPLGATGLVDPLLQFRQLRTPHFVIYFHDGEASLAARLAPLVEQVRDEVGASLGTSPPGLTHVVIADQSELANGWATPLPRDIVFLNAAVPSGAETIGRTDDWLRLVFTHEYTHIVHLDRSRGWARVARGIFGRTPVAFPNMWLPQWEIEGLATWNESAITREGRWFAGDFRAIERVAAAGGHPLSLDRASGGLVRWPSGHAAYAAGLGFHAYLADRFGEATLGTLSTRTAGRVPFFGSGAFRQIYGRSLGRLWRDYTASVEQNAGAARTRPDAARRLTTHGNTVSGPRFAPALCAGCSDWIVYSLQGPHAFPSLRTVDVDGRGDRELTTRYLGSAVAVHGATVVFDQQELRRNVGQYSDLYSLDRATGRLRALTRDARLQDPDASRDGSRIVAVRESRGRRELVVTSAGVGQSDVGNLRVIASEPETQFAAPRWSPDGRLVAAERRAQGTLPHVVLVDTQNGLIVQTIAIDGARVVTPAWTPDGRTIVAAADLDHGPFELYAFPLEGSPHARRLTHSAGALWPDVSADGKTIVFAGYTTDGYDVFTLPYPVGADGADGDGGSDASDRGDDIPFRRDGRAARETQRDLAGVDPVRSVDASSIVQQARTYSPLSTLAPTSWTPLLSVSETQTRVGGGIAGSDVLGRHAYALGVTWLARGPAGADDVPASPDWTATYVYARWRPSLFVALSSDTLFGRSAADDGRAAALRAVEHRTEAGVVLPVVHVRERIDGIASLVRTNTHYFESGAADRSADRTRGAETVLVSTRLGLGFDSTRLYGYSISPEDGLRVGSTLEIARRALGSTANASTVTVDARAYVAGLRRHHVLALRAAGGLSSGEPAARQTFALESVSASPGVVDFGSTALGLMRDGGRGGPGTRIVAGNAEYRFPLGVVEHGIGTWPLFVRTVHVAVFADVGSLRGGSADGQVRHAVGAELGATGVAGYALPFNASVGVALGGGDAAHRGGVTLYGRIGRSF